MVAFAAKSSAVKGAEEDAHLIDCRHFAQWVAG